VAQLSADDGEPFAFIFNCPHCGGPTELQCVAWENNKRLESAPFLCPYCRRMNTPELPARLMWAVRVLSPGMTDRTH
jgi:hypothetical protein